jgi:hypothetical protein
MKMKSDYDKKVSQHIKTKSYINNFDEGFVKKKCECLIDDDKGI